MGHPNRQRGKQEQQLIERVAALAGTWPKVGSGVDGFGHMTFRAGKKSFVIIGESYEGGGGASMAIKSDPVNQDALIRTGRYTRTPYIGQHGWVSVESGKLHWDELETLIADAYESVAPKKKISVSDSSPPTARVEKHAKVMTAAATKPGAKKPGVKKSTAKKSAPKKSALKKPTAKKSVAKKPATRKAAGNKRSARKSSRKK